MAIVDYFLKIDGIEGESQDSKHKGEIDIESWSVGATQMGTQSAMGGGGAGKVQWQDVHFVAKNSKASPKLMLACANGEHIKKAVLVCRKAGGEQEEHLKITLSDFLISGYSLSSGGDRPSESLMATYSTTKSNIKNAPAGARVMNELENIIFSPIGGSQLHHGPHLDQHVGRGIFSLTGGSAERHSNFLCSSYSTTKSNIKGASGDARVNNEIEYGISSPTGPSAEAVVVNSSRSNIKNNLTEEITSVDHITLNFSKIEYEYKEQKADGTLGGTVKSGWDVKGNKKV